MAVRTKRTGRDRYVVRDGVRLEAHEQISELFEAYYKRKLWHREKLAKSKPGRAIEKSSAEQRRDIVVALHERVDHMRKRCKDGFAKVHSPEEICGEIAYEVIEQLIRKPLPFSGEDLVFLVAEKSERDFVFTDFRPANTLKACERFAKDHAIEGRLRVVLKRWHTRLRNKHWRTHDHLVTPRRRVEELLGLDISLPFDPKDPWTTGIRTDIEASKHHEAWRDLVLLCAAIPGSASKPSARWSKSVFALLEQIGETQFAKHATRWLDALVDDWPKKVHESLARGLCWCSGLVASPPATLARALSRVAEAGYVKQRAPGVANAALKALGDLETDDGVTQLAIAQTRVRNRSGKKQVEKAQAAAAAARGVDPDEFEELGVPTFGFTAPGVLEETFGDETAVVEVANTSRVKIVWRKPNGNIQKSVPASVRREQADALKALRARVRDIQKMLRAQRERIDRMFLDPRSWSLEVWRERYLDHPLVGIIARRLIWRFQYGKTIRTGIDQDGALVDAKGKTLAPHARSKVSLWHPLDGTTKEALAWRSWIETNAVTQPFKQAHREIYLLTDAERETRRYSNRFAAHIVRQHQLNALCAVRGWKHQTHMRNTYDPVEVTHRVLAHWKLRAEYWADTVVVDSGYVEPAQYLSTDQVRFLPADSETTCALTDGSGWRSADVDSLPLEKVPPLVFSEILRDVDLFVGAASVGNDPEWQDGGLEGLRGQHRDYWELFSFGELGQTAQTRREVLERLVPQLKIADRCTFEGRYLVVQGDRHRYRIHIGSSNVLIDGQSQYLCIVSRGLDPQVDRIALPFEGDYTLALILSKAFLLANDTKIEKQSILRQLGG